MLRKVTNLSRQGGGQNSAAHNHRVLAFAAALAAMLIWGGTPLFSKLATSQIDPLLVGVLRTVVAAALAIPLLVASGHRLPSDRRDRQLLALSGFAAFVVFPILFTVGQNATSALHGALALATLPIFTSFFGMLVERRPVSAVWLIGCLIALSSEAVVIAWSTGGESRGASLRGNLLVLGAALVCAMGYVAGARLSQRGYPATSTTLWGVTLSAAALLPLAVWLLIRNGWPQAGVVAWGSVLVLAILTSVLGYVAWYWALGIGGISRMASIQFTQPVFGVAFAAIVLGDRPAPLVALAGIGVLAGAWLVLRAGSASTCRTGATGGNIRVCPAANQPMQWTRDEAWRHG
jgi:drug/metabolite transporter (DMT)-like permease